MKFIGRLVFCTVNEVFEIKKKKTEIVVYFIREIQLYPCLASSSIPLFEKLRPNEITL